MDKHFVHILYKRDSFKYRKINDFSLCLGSDHLSSVTGHIELDPTADEVNGNAPFTSVVQDQVHGG